MNEYLIVGADGIIVDQIDTMGGYESMLEELVRRVENGELSLSEIIGSSAYLKCGGNLLGDVIKSVRDIPLPDDEDDEGSTCSCDAEDNEIKLEISIKIKE